MNNFFPLKTVYFIYFIFCLISSIYWIIDNCDAIRKKILPELYNALYIIPALKNYWSITTVNYIFYKNKGCVIWLNLERIWVYFSR